MFATKFVHSWPFCFGDGLMRESIKDLPQMQIIRFGFKTKAYFGNNTNTAINVFNQRISGYIFWFVLQFGHSWLF
jgi:hypothetical protein